MRKFEFKENYRDILRETETATGIKKCNRVEINQQLGDSWAKQKDIDGLYKNQNKMQSLHHSQRLHQVLRQKEVIFDKLTFLSSSSVVWDCNSSFCFGLSIIFHPFLTIWPFMTTWFQMPQVASSWIERSNLLMILLTIKNCWILLSREHLTSSANIVKNLLVNLTIWPDTCIKRNRFMTLTIWLIHYESYYITHTSWLVWSGESKLYLSGYHKFSKFLTIKFWICW